LVAARTFGKRPGTHFDSLTGADAAYKHCNPLGPRLYNTFPLKFDPLRPRFGEPASVRENDHQGAFRS
jgi:hypothetical protein